MVGDVFKIPMIIIAMIIIPAIKIPYQLRVSKYHLTFKEVPPPFAIQQASWGAERR